MSRELEEQGAGGDRLPSSNATPYTLFRKVPVSDNHADLKRTQDDGPAPDLAVAHPGTETGGYMLPPFNATPAYPSPLPGSQDPAETHARKETDGYMSPQFNTTSAYPFPQPTSSIPLWNHARQILGRPSYFHQTMLKHYPWDEKVPNFATQGQAAGREAGEGEQREDDNDNGDETIDEDDDDDRYEEEKDQEQEPFLSRHHDCVLHVEQFLSDFSVQLTACKYWEDEDALHQLQDLLTIAREQVCMLEQPRPADGDV